MQYNPHPLADIFPLMSGEEFVNLKQDIKEHGLREPIWIMDGQILDGRNRFNACQEVGVEPVFREYEGKDAAAFVISLNLHRRHLDEGQRGSVAAKLANIKNGGDRKTDQSANLHSDSISLSQAAEMLNVSRRTVATAKKVIENGSTELIKAMDDGKVSVSAAADVSTLPKETQKEIVAKGRDEILAAAKEIRLKESQQRKVELAQVKEQLKAQPIQLPDGKYSCIVIDPPWEMEKIERDITPGQVAFEYPTMNEEELAAFPVPDMAADDCHMFCWTTHKHLPMSLRLLDAWGFRYVLTMVWHKNGGFQPFGLPMYNCEFAIYARKGTPKFMEFTDFKACFQYPRREHSRKPDEFYETVKRVTVGPRIDVFSRERRDGFAQFGNETEKFAA